MLLHKLLPLVIFFVQTHQFYSFISVDRLLVSGSIFHAGKSEIINRISKLLIVNSVISDRREIEIPSLKGLKTKISSIVPQEDIIAIRVRHIEVATKEIADECYNLITSGSYDFHNLAVDLSICDASKSKGGDLGWQSIIRTSQNDSYDSIPLEMLNTLCMLNKGDLRVISSINNINGVIRWHVCQLMDVQTKLNKNMNKRRLENYQNKKGIMNNRQLTYNIETMGCQMNSADSERIEGQLRELGYTLIGDSSKANLVVINTCSIRDHAEHKVYSHIGPHALRKRQGEDVSIIIAGCVAQQEGEKLTRRFPEVDVVMGPQYANRMDDLLEAVADGYQVVVTDPSYQTEDQILPSRSSSFSAWVNIIYGCNERCTYCVVPNTRGVEQSRTKEAILSEVSMLATQGYREIFLLGQNIDAWGRDMSPKQLFADLLTSVASVTGVERVRFLTSHPRYMSERVIAAVAANPAIAPCFNVPFQSGDNEVLRNMRRGYSRERYLEIVRDIRKHLPDAAITADVIVGFPGETEEQFLNTLDVMNQVEFELVNTAAYSPRPNTPAALWDALQIPEDVKQERLQRIMQLANEHAYKRSQRFMGRVQEILVEDVNPKKVTQVFGRNEHSRIVYFDGNISQLKGKFVPVLIKEARAYSLTGEIVGLPR